MKAVESLARNILKVRRIKNRKKPSERERRACDSKKVVEAERPNDFFTRFKKQSIIMMCNFLSLFSNLWSDEEYTLLYLEYFSFGVMTLEWKRGPSSSSSFQEDGVKATKMLKSSLRENPLSGKNSFRRQEDGENRICYYWTKVRDDRGSSFCLFQRKRIGEKERLLNIEDSSFNGRDPWQMIRPSSPF